MTVIGVLVADHGCVGSTEHVVDQSVVDACLCDVVRAVSQSGGDWQLLPIESSGGSNGTARDRAKSILEMTALDADTDRITVPGETELRSLLDVLHESSAEATAAVVNPITPFIQRRHIDAAAMRLRRNEVVVGPTAGPHWYYFGTQADVSLESSDTDFETDRAITDMVDPTMSVDLLPYLTEITSEQGRRMLDTHLRIVERTGGHAAPYTREHVLTE